MTSRLTDPGHTKVSPVGLWVSVAHMPKWRKDLASSTSPPFSAQRVSFCICIDSNRTHCAERRIPRFLWVLVLQGDVPIGYCMLFKQNKLFEAMQCLPSHTQVGVQEGNSFLALDIHQACLDRTGQICLISLLPFINVRHLLCWI